MTSIVLGEKRDNAGGGWRRDATVGGKRYTCSVRAVGRIRIPFKPRGTYGIVWEGVVYDETGRCILSERINGSLGVRGLLRLAGVISPPAPRLSVADVLQAGGTR